MSHWADNIHGPCDGRGCSCGSGYAREEILDARGIFVAYVCDKCKRDKLRGYRRDIFTNSQYDTFGDRVD